MKWAASLLGSYLVLALLVGCGGGGSSTPPSNPGGNGGGSGGAGSPLPAGTELLYVGDNVGVIHGFGVDPGSGKLTPLPTMAFTNAPSAGDVGLAADAGGHVLYAASAGIGGPNLASFAVDQTTGILTVASQLSLTVPVRKLAAAVGGGSSGSGCCLYVIPDPAANSAELLQFTIDKFTGALTEVSPAVTLPCIPHDLAASPSGSWIGFTCEGTSGGEIVTLSRDPLTGALGSPAGVPSGGDNPQGIRVTPDGKFVIVVNQGTSTVSVFSLDPSTGALAAVTGSPFPSGSEPAPVAIGPNDNFVFVGDTGGNSLSPYSIDSAGALTPVTATPIPLGNTAQPSSIAVDPAGKLVYVSIVPREVAGFALNPTTGALTPLPGSPFSLGAVTRDMVFVP